MLTHDDGPTAPDRVAAALVAFAATDADGGRWGAMTEYLLAAADAALTGRPFDDPTAMLVLDSTVRARDQNGTELRQDEQAGALLAVLTVAALVSGLRSDSGVGGRASDDRVARTVWSHFRQRWPEAVSWDFALKWMRSVSDAVANPIFAVLPPPFVGIASRSSGPPLAAFDAARRGRFDVVGAVAPGWIDIPIDDFGILGRALAAPSVPSPPGKQSPAPVFRRTEVSLFRSGASDSMAGQID